MRRLTALAMLAFPLAVLRQAQAAPDAVLPVQPTSAWTITADTDNPKVTGSADVATPAGPGVRFDATGDPVIDCSCAHAAKRFTIPVHTAQGASLSFYYKAEMDAPPDGGVKLVATSFTLAFFNSGAEVGRRSFAGLVPDTTGCPIDEFVGNDQVLTIELESFLGAAVFDEIEVTFHFYGCVMTASQTISDLILKTLVLVCPPLPKEQDNIWVKAGNPFAAPPFTTRRTAAKTIQDALAAWTPGKMIFVLRGSYPERLQLTKKLNGIRIHGESFGVGTGPVWDGTGTGRPLSIEGVEKAEICGFQIRKGKSASRGGGMRIVDARDIFLKHCTFELNEAEMGGGVYAENSTGSIKDSLFRNGNTAVRAGGAMAVKGNTLFRRVKRGEPSWKIERCVFEDNHVSNGVGGAVAVFGDLDALSAFEEAVSGGETMHLDGCRFTRNRAMRPGVGPFQGSGNGGAFYCEGQLSDVAMSDAEFVENIGGLNGGGIAAGAISKVLLKGTKLRFTGNEAPEGGACYATTLGFIEVALEGTQQRGVFERNKAVEGIFPGEGSGGAVNVTCGGIFQARNCDFLGNEAVLHGGGVQAREGKLDLAGCTFTANKAGRDGGAIALRSRASGNARCDKLPSVLKVRDITVEGNKAEGRGGAVFADYGDALPGKVTVVSLAGGALTGNSAEEGIHDHPANEIHLHNTGESRRALASMDPGLFGLFGRFTKEFMEGGDLRRGDDTLQDLTVTAKSPLMKVGIGIAVDHVCNNLVVGGQETCILDRPDTVLAVKGCSVSGFRTGIDILESSHILVSKTDGEVTRKTLVQGNHHGVLLDDAVADLEHCKIRDNTIGVEIRNARSLGGGNFIGIRESDIVGGPQSFVGVRLETDVLPLQPGDAGAPRSSVEINRNNFSGHPRPLRYGVEILDHRTGFAIDARQNFWGNPLKKGPDDPSDDTAFGGLYNPNPGADGVTDGVYYEPSLAKSR